MVRSPLCTMCRTDITSNGVGAEQFSVPLCPSAMTLIFLQTKAGI